MSRLNYTPKSKKGQHLNYEERQKIEILLKWTIVSKVYK